jgi:DUF4097 and DUF4098 domain-containing protein YvlB
MKKSKKIWLIVAASLLLAGLILFTSAMTVSGWDLSKLSTAKLETNEYSLSEKFNNISITTDTADIEFVATDTAEVSVICYEQVNSNHSVSVENDTLVIKLTDTRKWYEYVGINFSSPKITVNIPLGEYTSLSIDSSTSDVNVPSGFTFEHINISGHTGDISLDGISAKSIDLSVSTGDVSVANTVCDGDIKVTASTGDMALTDVKCKNFTSDGDTGDISLKNVISSEKIFIERDTGDVNFDRCDASEIFVETDTGEVKGSLLSPKVFIAESDTGDINVPSTITGGRCEISTDTGDINITVIS